jgi:aspartate racemase
MNNNKKLGIIGGMGPQATQYFYKKIIDNTLAKNDQEHIDMMIINHATIPDRTATILSGNYDDFLKAIGDDIKMLEIYGACHIAIPCNTTHYFYKEIQSKTKIPIINMIEETLTSILNNKDTKKIGILATDGTIQTKIYENECIKRGVEAVIPSPQSQKKIMSIIYDEIKSGDKGDINKFMEVVNELREKGCDAIILACTELSYLNENYDIPSYCVDALDVLVKKSIELSGKKIK